jgi:membrane-associated phospholipid phosphatase
MSKKHIVIIAEYGVIVQGVILLLLAREEDTLSSQCILFVTAGALLLLSLCVTKLLKRIIHKHRPQERDELFVPFDTYAFPSGHATGLASVTFFISLHSLFLGIVSLCVAFAIVYARVKARVHDYYDIAAGVLVGVAVTYLMRAPVEAFISGYIVPAFFSN